MSRPFRPSGPPPGHPEAAKHSLIVMVERGSTHETAVAAAAQAAARMSLLTPDRTGQGRLLIGESTKAWRDDERRECDVRIAPLRHIQRAVDIARALGINYEGFALPGGRVVVFEPVPEFNATRPARQAQPLVLDLPRDPVTLYEHALAGNEGLRRPVLAFTMRESKGTALAVGHAANVALTARHHLDVRYEGDRAFIDLEHLDRWRADDFRTEVTFTPANACGADLSIGVRTRT